MAKALDFQNFPFPMVGGLDTKISGVALPAPKLQLCQNAYADKSGSLKKRAGNLALTSNLVSGSTIGTPIALASYKDNQIAFSNNNAYEYGSTAAAWFDKGTAYSFRVRTENVNYGVSGNKPLTVDMATAGSVTVYASMNSLVVGANVKTTVLVTVVDADGTVYKSDKQLYTITNAGGERNAVRCIALGTRIYVLYYDSSVTSLMCWVLDTTSASTINTGLGASAATLANDINTTTSIFDVAVGASSSQPFVVYRTTAGGVGALKFGFITTVGSLNPTTTTHATVAGALGVAAAVNATTGHGVVYTVGTTPNDIYAVIKTFTGAWANVAASGAIEAVLGSIIFPRSVGCLWETSTSLRLWYSGNGTGANLQTYQSTYTTTGVATARVQTLRHSCLAAKPFIGTDGNMYFWSYTGEPLSIIQPTLFLMRYDGVVTAWANQSVAFWPSLIGWPPSVQTSGSTFTMLTGFLSKARDGLGTYVGLDSQVGVRVIAVDMTHAQSHKTVEIGDSLYMAGGFLQTYDGNSFVESGFLQICNNNGTTGEHVTISSSATAGTLVAGDQYTYMVVPEWTNERGERQQGTNDGSISATVAALQSAMDIVIPCTPYTLKKSPRANMGYALYRTGPNPTSDAEFHRCGFIENDPAANTVTFTDTDGDVSDSEPFYQDGGVLENIAPPAGYILAQGGGRAFIAGLSDDKHQILASKTRDPGEPVSFNDTLIIQVPELGGAITGLEYMNEQLVIFKEKAIYLLPRGGGPNGETGINNLGSGVFLIPEIVNAADTGCTGQRSVLNTPMGVIFQGVKGLMLLDQARQVQYIGAPLEGLSIGTITGAALLPTFQQVRFATTGGTYVFDYYHKIWSFYTLTSAAVTVAQSGVYVTIGSGTWAGLVLMEDAATFTDSGTAILMKVRLAWVASEGARQASLRFRWVGLVATPSAVATVRMQVSINFLAAVTQTFDAVYTSGELNAPARRQVRINAASQLASAMQIELDDQSATNASVTLHAIDFNMAPRKNFDRLLGADS